MEEERFNKAVSLQKEIKELKSKIEDLGVQKKEEGSKFDFKAIRVEVEFNYRSKKGGYSYAESFTAKKHITVDRKMVEHLYYQYKNQLMAQLNKLENDFSKL